MILANSDQDPGGDMVKSIDYTRPLSEYPTASEVADGLRGRTEIHEINLNNLSVHGEVVLDDMDTYLSRRDYYSSSALKAANISPKSLYIEYESGEKEKLEALSKPKKHSTWGTMIHECILEPKKFSLCVVEPIADRTTTKGIDILITFWEDKINTEGGFLNRQQETPEVILKAAASSVKAAGFNTDKMNGKRFYYELLKKISGCTVLSEEEKIKTGIMRRNYFGYGGGSLFEFMRGATPEVSMYYTDPSTGIKVRIRPDAIQIAENVGFNTIISVKSTKAKDIRKFYYDAAKYAYELSEGMYQEVAEGVTGRPFLSTVMIMIQTVMPYDIAVFVWNGEDIEIGKYKYHQALLTVKDCKESGKYPGFDAFAENGNAGFIDMKLPDWISKELYPVDINDESDDTDESDHPD